MAQSVVDKLTQVDPELFVDRVQFSSFSFQGSGVDIIDDD